MKRRTMQRSCMGRGTLRCLLARGAGADPKESGAAHAGT